jgi:hypothetical protein
MARSLARVPQDVVAAMNAESPVATLDATIWLMVHQPDRLPTWFEHHALGLEKAAREELAKRKRHGEDDL